jgi:hypothetical protein
MGYPHVMKRLVWIMVISLSPWKSWAVPVPLRCQNGLDEPVSEIAYRVKTARVILADYSLIKRDFPSVGASTDPEIDEWLVQNAGWVAKSQYRLGSSVFFPHVNTPIQADTQNPRTAYRPLGYGRALVFKVGDEGLIDAKGVGAINPFPGSHSTGLGTLAEMIQEFAFEKLVHKIFQHGGSDFETIETYAVLDMGFSIYHNDQKIPAGAVLRQAHKRYSGGPSGIRLSDEKALAVEKLLRRYGVTSAGEGYLQDQEDQVQDVQGSEDGAIVDFGTYMVLDEFKSPLLGADFWPHFFPKLLDPESANFIQPDLGLRVATSYWGIEFQGGEMIDQLTAWTSSWAEKISRDESGKSRKKLAKFLNTLYDHETRRWDLNDVRILNQELKNRKKSVERQHPYFLREKVHLKHPN